MKIINDLSKKSVMALMAGAITLGTGAFATKNSTKAQNKNNITTTNPLPVSTDNQKTVNAYQAYANLNTTKSYSERLDTDEKIVNAYNSLSQEEKSLVLSRTDSIFDDIVDDLTEQTLRIYYKYNLFSENNSSETAGRYLLNGDINDVAEHGKMREKQLMQAREELVNNVWKAPSAPSIKVPEKDFHDLYRNMSSQNYYPEDNESSYIESKLLELFYDGARTGYLSPYTRGHRPGKYTEERLDSIFTNAINSKEIDMPKTFEELKNNFKKEFDIVKKITFVGDGVKKYEDFWGPNPWATSDKGRIYKDYTVLVDGYNASQLIDIEQYPDAYKISGIIKALDYIDGFESSAAAHYTHDRLGREEYWGSSGYTYDNTLALKFSDFGKVAMQKSEAIKYHFNPPATLNAIPNDMGWIQKKAFKEAIGEIKEESLLRKDYLRLTDASRKKLVEIIYPYGNDYVSNDEINMKYMELSNKQYDEEFKLYDELMNLYMREDGPTTLLDKDWFEGYLGDDLVINCPGGFQDGTTLDILREKIRYIDILLYNYVNNTVNNIKNPNNTDSIKVDKLELFEIAAQDTLNCSSEEFQAKYAKELEEIKNMKGQAKSRGLTSTSGLSESAAKVLEKVEAFRTKLASLYAFNTNTNGSPFNVYNDYISNELKNAVDDISDSRIIHENYKNPSNFRLPKSWIYKDAYIKALKQVISEDDNIDGIDEINSDNKNTSKTRKFLQNGQIIIEKTNNDGTKNQYNTSGERIK